MKQQTTGKKPASRIDPRRTRPQAKPSAGPANPFFQSLFKNFLMFLGAVLLIYALRNYNAGYQWMFQTLLKENLKMMKEYKDISLEQKYEGKLGFSYRFLNNIKKSTPENAIVILPPDTVLRPPGGKSDFSEFITTKMWASYFVYPRKLIYEHERETSPYYDSATHVAIANYWGYDKLEYPVSNPAQYSVMPIKQNQTP